MRPHMAVRSLEALIGALLLYAPAAHMGAAYSLAAAVSGAALALAGLYLPLALAGGLLAGYAAAAHGATLVAPLVPVLLVALSAAALMEKRLEAAGGDVETRCLDQCLAASLAAGVGGLVAAALAAYGFAALAEASLAWPIEAARYAPPRLQALLLFLAESSLYRAAVLSVLLLAEAWLLGRLLSDLAYVMAATRAELRARLRRELAEEARRVEDLGRWYHFTRRRGLVATFLTLPLAVTLYGLMHAAAGVSGGGTVVASLLLGYPASRLLVRLYSAALEAGLDWRRAAKVGAAATALALAAGLAAGGFLDSAARSLDALGARLETFYRLLDALLSTLMAVFLG